MMVSRREKGSDPSLRLVLTPCSPLRVPPCYCVTVLKALRSQLIADPSALGTHPFALSTFSLGTATSHVVATTTIGIEHVPGPLSIAVAPTLSSPHGWIRIK
jgi:hypothetical protein